MTWTSARRPAPGPVILERYEQARPYVIPAIVALVVLLIGWTATSPYALVGSGWTFERTGWPQLLSIVTVLISGAAVLIAVRWPVVATALAAGTLVVPTMATDAWHVASYVALLGLRSSPPEALCGWASSRSR